MTDAQTGLFDWAPAKVDEKLYDGRPPHESASETSRQAAEQLGSERRDTLRRAVLTLIMAAGDRGLTDDEMQVELGLRSQTQSPRRRELQLMGLVCDSGERRLTRAGRLAAVWVIADPVRTRRDLADAFHSKLGAATLPQPKGKHRHKFQFVERIALNGPNHPDPQWYESYQPLPCPVCEWAWLKKAIEKTRVAA